MTFQRSKPGCRRPNYGFTLVEIMIVVVIIGLLAALGVPAWARARRNSQNSALANDLRQAAYAAQTYAFESGAWPAEVGPGIQPPELAPYLNTLIWTLPTPVGGSWDWDYSSSGSPTAAISIVNPAADVSQMQAVDLKIDDGNLSTGKFQASGTKYIYILE